MSISGRSVSPSLVLAPKAGGSEFRRAVRAARRLDRNRRRAELAFLGYRLGDDGLSTALLIRFTCLTIRNTASATIRKPMMSLRNWP